MTNQTKTVIRFEVYKDGKFYYVYSENIEEAKKTFVAAMGDGSFGIVPDNKDWSTQIVKGIEKPGGHTYKGPRVM